MAQRLLIIAVYILSVSPLYGQDSLYYEKLVAKGNRYYDDEQYHLAIQFYRDALSLNQPDAAVDYKLARCYQNTFNYAEAEGYYLKVFYTGQNAFPLSLYYYALMLKLNGNISEAMERFEEFIYLHEHNASMKAFVEQAIIEKAGCEFSLYDKKVFARWKASLAEGTINSPYNDFAPAFRDPQTLIVTSGRVVSNRTLIDERYGESFTDNYYFERKGSTWEDKTRQRFAAANSRSNDGSGSFTKKGDWYFFTICDAQCRIYETREANGKWTKPEPLNEKINYPGSESKQPSISPTGDTLFFSSNRPGGYGQLDIWMSVRGKSGEWTTPVNAGATINTNGNEIAPARTSLSNVLFFASNGHPGYGGYDLFVAKNGRARDTVVYNMNPPFNSVMDDCYLTFNGDELFWSSNRPGGQGGFDIYTTQKLSALAIVSKLAMENRNDSRVVTLTSRTARSENIHLLASRNEESIDYNNLTYERKEMVNRMVQNRMNDRENRPEDFAGLEEEEFGVLNGLSQSRFQSLMLKQKYSSTLLSEVIIPAGSRGSLSISGYLVNAHSGTGINGSRILLTDVTGDILKITTVNKAGEFRFTDVPEDKRLFLRLEKQFGRKLEALLKDVAVAGSGKSSSPYVENVYFDFDHYLIRPEAEQVVADLADYLKSHPGSQVEIHAFADDRGSSSYNFELTEKRGEAVASFLTSRGVDETSVAIIPRGKQPLTRSVSEVQRQYNRRAEFYINGNRQTVTPSMQTVILKRNCDWNLISKLTGISKQELKIFNGAIEDGSLNAFQPIRLPVSVRDLPEEWFFVGI